MYTLTQGHISPLRQLFISPCFRFPPIFEIFCLTRGKFFQFNFSGKNFRFFIRKISDYLFLLIDYKFQFPSYFRCFSTFAPHFGKIIILLPILFSPYFYKFPPWFPNFYVFSPTFCVFRFPLLLPWCIYASHNTVHYNCNLLLRSWQLDCIMQFLKDLRCFWLFGLYDAPALTFILVYLFTPVVHNLSFPGVINQCPNPVVPKLFRMAASWLNPGLTKAPRVKF